MKPARRSFSPIILFAGSPMRGLIFAAVAPPMDIYARKSLWRESHARVLSVSKSSGPCDSALVRLGVSFALVGVGGGGIDRMRVRFDRMRVRFDRMRVRFDRMRVRFDRMRVRFDRIRVRFDRIRVRFDRMRVRFDRMRVRFDRMRVRFDRMRVRFVRLYPWILGDRRRLAGLGSAITAFFVSLWPVLRGSAFVLCLIGNSHLFKSRETKQDGTASRQSQSRRQTAAAA